MRGLLLFIRPLGKFSSYQETHWAYLVQFCCRPLLAKLRRKWRRSGWCNGGCWLWHSLQKYLNKVVSSNIMRHNSGAKPLRSGSYTRVEGVLFLRASEKFLRTFRREYWAQNLTWLELLMEVRIWLSLSQASRMQTSPNNCYNVQD